MVVGSGYVGLSTAVVMSAHHDVTVVETDEQKVSSIASGKPPFYESNMESRLKGAVAQGKLRAVASTSIPEPHDFVILCVGTPADVSGRVITGYLKEAVSYIDTNFEGILDGYLTIVVRSTVPPGTTRSLVLERLARRHEESSFGVVFNPEFMRQGSAMADITAPDRVILGASDIRAAAAYRQLISTILEKPDTPVHEMSMESAELSKYAANCFLAMKVSFASEISGIAERLPTIRIDDVMSAVGADERINPSHLKPGLGFGGTCLPKDLVGLISYGHDLGLPMTLLEAVKAVNDMTSTRIMKLLDRVSPDVRGKKVSVLGLAFKEGTDDTRASQSLQLITQLVHKGAKVYVHDPIAADNNIDPDIRSLIIRCPDLDSCLTGSCAVIIMTDWPVYRKTGLQRLTSRMSAKVVIDGVRAFVDSEIPPEVCYVSLGSHINC